MGSASISKVVMGLATSSRPQGIAMDQAMQRCKAGAKVEEKPKRTAKGC